MKATGDPQAHEQYKQIRRSNKKIFRDMAKDHIDSTIYKPMLEGNSKPFYIYLNNEVLENRCRHVESGWEMSR